MPMQVPPMGAEQTRRVIQRELGDIPLEQVFEWIDLDVPLGSASIAQVCCAARSCASGVRHPLACMLCTHPCMGISSPCVPNTPLGLQRGPMTDDDDLWPLTFCWPQCYAIILTLGSAARRSTRASCACHSGRSGGAWRCTAWTLTCRWQPHRARTAPGVRTQGSSCRWAALPPRPGSPRVHRSWLLQVPGTPQNKQRGVHSRLLHLLCSNPWQRAHANACVVAGAAEGTAGNGQGEVSAASSSHEASVAVRRALEAAAAQGRSGIVAVKVSLHSCRADFLQALRSQHAYAASLDCTSWMHDLGSCMRRCSTQTRCRR
jgi:hypothetical protein